MTLLQTDLLEKLLDQGVGGLMAVAMIVSLLIFIRYLKTRDLAAKAKDEFIERLAGRVVSLAANSAAFVKGSEEAIRAMRDQCRDHGGLMQDIRDSVKACPERREKEVASG